MLFVLFNLNISYLIKAECSKCHASLYFFVVNELFCSIDMAKFLKPSEFINMSVISYINFSNIFITFSYHDRSVCTLIFYFAADTGWEEDRIDAEPTSSTLFVYNEHLALAIEQQRKRLPIFKNRKQILYLLEKYQTLVLVGETGSGKSTQLPQVLLYSCREVRFYWQFTYPFMA